MVGLAVVAPIAWMASDAVVTGQPAYSFTRTRAIAENTGERGGVVETLIWQARSSKGILHLVPAVAALGGLVAGLRHAPARTLPPAVLMALGSVSFLATGFSGLPLLIRYFLLPATLLCLFAAVAAVAAVAVLGWHAVPAGTAVRTWWARLAAVGLLALGASLPWEARSLHRLTSNFGAASSSATCGA